MVRTKDKLGENVMDNREAIQLLDKLLLRSDFTDQYGDMGDSSPYEEAVEIARQAIEKQIPKKVKREFLAIGGAITCIEAEICPNCGKDIYDDEVEVSYYEYCPDCGQALDWSDENE